MIYKDEEFAKMNGEIMQDKGINVLRKNRTDSFNLQL